MARTNVDGSVTATMPTSSTLAQPGYRMMFALNAAGVPSVASWVHLGDPTYQP